MVNEKAELEAARAKLSALFDEGRLGDLESVIGLVIQVLLQHIDAFPKHEQSLEDLKRNVEDDQAKMNVSLRDIAERVRLSSENATSELGRVEHELSVKVNQARMDIMEKSQLFSDRAVSELSKMEQALSVRMQGLEDALATAEKAAKQADEKAAGLSHPSVFDDCFSVEEWPERIGTEKAAAKNVSAENAAAEKAAAEKITAEKAAAEKAAAEKAAAEKAAAERAAAEKAAAEKAAAEKAAAEKAAAEKAAKVKAAAQKAAKEKAAAEKITVEKAAAEEAAAEKNAAEKAAAERAAAEKAAAEKAAAEKVAAEKTAAGEVAADKAVTDHAQEDRRAAHRRAVAERLAAEEQANESAKQQPIVELEVEGRYQVVHDRIAFRKAPSIDAGICGRGKKDMELVGTPCQVGSTQWLRLNKQKSTAVTLVGGTLHAWVLIDGTQLGVSVLLRRMKDYERMTRTQIAELMAQCKPALISNEPESGNQWVVVGGIGKGGIMVRRNKDLSSNPFPIKLVPGALIEELEVDGNRLHYRRLHGDGPDFGWVTIEHAGRHLVELWHIRHNKDDE